MVTIPVTVTCANCQKTEEFNMQVTPYLTPKGAVMPAGWSPAGFCLPDETCGGMVCTTCTIERETCLDS